MALEKTIIEDNVQNYIGLADWQKAIVEMKKLYEINPDPIIRVRIGDFHKKLGQCEKAAREYLSAARQYFDLGFIDKALAQCRLVLRIEPENTEAPWMITLFQYAKSTCGLNLEPLEGISQPQTDFVIMSTIDCWKDQLQHTRQDNSRQNHAYVQ